VAVWAQSVGMSQLIYSNHATITGGIVNWGTYQQISPDEWTGYEPQIAISGDNVAAIWRGSSGGSDSIYSNYSANGGENWTGVQAVDNNGNPAYGGPQIVISGNTTVTIWRQYDGSSQHIYSNYAIIDNGVITWVPEQTIMVSNNYYAVNDPKIATSGNTVVAIWQQVESSSSNNQIYSKYATISSEGIPTWNSEDQLVGYDAEQLSEKPQIAISGDNVAAVWVKNDGVLYDRIYSNYTTISDAGAVLWDTTNVDTVSNSDAGGDNPQIAISGNNVVAVWKQLAAGNNPPSSVYSNYARVAADSNSGDGGSLPIGPLAAGLSGFLTWWKRRKQRHG